MEAYKSETREIVRRFREHRITHAECVASLNAALARVVHRMAPEDLPAVRFEVLRNYGLVSEYSLKSRPLWPLEGDTATLQ